MRFRRPVALFVGIVLQFAPVQNSHAAGRNEKQRVLVLALDCSGSMAHSDPGRRRIEAAELLVAAADQNDQVGVIAFGDGPRWLGPQSISPRSQFQMRTLQSVGQSDQHTDFAALFREWNRFLDGEPDGYFETHEVALVVLTDGVPDSANETSAENGQEALNLASRASRNSAINVIALGREAKSSSFLSDLSVRGHGRSAYAIEPETGRRYQLGDLGAPGGAAPSKGNPHYEFLGVTRYWRYSKQNMEKLHAEGKIVQTKPGTVPRLKRYLDEGKGVPLGSVWDDIGPVQSSAKEKIGYPTQKPLKLLDRIVEISSKEGDVVLDAFCGCGTALVAAQSKGRQWIGIDVSPTACRVMAKRMRDACGLVESEGLWKAHRGFVVRDLPWTEERLRKLPPFEFENWAVVAIGGIPNAAQVGDMGIDGRLFPVTSIPKHASVAETFAFMDDWFPIQVKQKDKAGRPDIDTFEAVMVRENRTLGYFVAFAYSADAEREVRRFKASSGREIRLLRVEELIDIDHERMVDKKKPVGRVEQLTLPGTQKKLG